MSVIKNNINKKWAQNRDPLTDILQSHQKIIKLKISSI